ncbi:MAG: hypothetical protein WAQ27_01125 [Candidatus Microsaccharimonas sp.]
MKFRNQSGSAHVVVIVVLIIAIIGALGFIFWQNFVQKDPVANTTQTTESTKDESDEAVKDGTISGSLTYPSEAIPDDFVVYAQNLDTNKEYSTSEQLDGAQYTYGKGFSVKVPAGRYYVYGVLTSDPDKKAYYNQVIVCGIKVECTDTTKVEVTVKADEDTSGVTVGDWWSL